jgi:hypothetical protein
MHAGESKSMLAIFALMPLGSTEVTEMNPNPVVHWQVKPMLHQLLLQYSRKPNRPAVRARMPGKESDGFGQCALVNFTAPCAQMEMLLLGCAVSRKLKSLA